MKSKRGLAILLASAVVAGYAGAAAFSAWGLPPVPVATGFGPDDGLTRYVLTASSGAASDDLLAALEATDGVVNAQRLSDGRALVATEGLARSTSRRSRASPTPTSPRPCRCWAP